MARTFKVQLKPEAPNQNLPGLKRLPFPMLLVFTLMATASALSAPPELYTGQACHAFDHLGNIGQQAEVAAACGANIIYTTGLGGFGYLGLPDGNELSRLRQANANYLNQARRRGIRLVIGYVCATSIVKLDTFDKNWTPEFRAKFHTAPSDWRQQDRYGRPLPSWYGGDYQPACMNNPDWRTYEHFMVEQQLKSGCDGIFFDNPTVHPNGCYCRYCMMRFMDFLKHKDERLSHESHDRILPSPVEPFSLEAARELAVTRSNDFLRFRCTIARDFLADMRKYARRVRPGALITANNSLNSPGVLYSQCRTYGYSPYEMSKTEDFVVVEDMSSQPRVLPNGKTMEYGPTYRQLHALCHGKPIVAVTIAEGDYHTPPDLVRLAMAEAAAHDASYLLWPTWPENQRSRMIAAVRPEVELLRKSEALLNRTHARRDAVLFLPFQRWMETNKCEASVLAAALTRANVQFEVITEDDLHTGKAMPAALKRTKCIVAESLAVFNPTELKSIQRFMASGGAVVTADSADWLAKVQSAIGGPPVLTRGPATVRAVVRDLKKATLVHLLNLNIQRLSSFEDKVTPATDIRVVCRVPFRKVHSVRALTADQDATSGNLQFTWSTSGKQTLVEVNVPKLQIATMLVIER
jgi:hypothetical protein